MLWLVEIILEVLELIFDGRESKKRRGSCLTDYSPDSFPQYTDWERYRSGNLR